MLSAIISDTLLFKSPTCTELDVKAGHKLAEIANVDLNILFLDELFSNMDVNARNIMISLLQENMGDDKTIFIINHAEMGDDMFSHKIRVKLEKKKIISASQKKGEPVIVQASKYEQEF